MSPEFFEFSENIIGLASWVDRVIVVHKFTISERESDMLRLILWIPCLGEERGLGCGGDEAVKAIVVGERISAGDGAPCSGNGFD